MTNSFSNKAARVISTLFVPPSFTIIIFTFLAFHLESEIEKILATLSVTYILGFTAPVILFLYLRKRKMIVDGDASIKEERTLPFAIAILFYITGLIVLVYFEVSVITVAFWFCYISNTLFTILINRYWKISAHAMGAAGPFAALTFLFGYSAMYFFVIVILVGWSRIQLKCHTFAQVAAGAVLAFFSTFIQIHLIVNYFN